MLQGDGAASRIVIGGTHGMTSFTLRCGLLWRSGGRPTLQKFCISVVRRRRYWRHLKSKAGPVRGLQRTAPGSEHASQGDLAQDHETKQLTCVTRRKRRRPETAEAQFGNADGTITVTKTNGWRAKRGTELETTFFAGLRRRDHPIRRLSAETLPDRPACTS